MYSKAGQRRARRSSLGKFTTVAIWAALANATSAATAYRAIDLTPNGSDSASANAAGGGWQVGTDDTTGHAILWSGFAASAIDLTPPGRHAAAGAVDATSQGGSVDNHAALWHGSAGSFVDLHPSGYSSSGVSGIGNGQQVGSVVTNDDNARTHAALWSGAANTFVDLHPTSGVYSSSYAAGTNGVQQVGAGTIGDPARAEYHALLWSGSADSAVELLPANSGYRFSDANAIAGDVKVGDGGAATVRALLWSGPQNQLTDLTPAWATDAALYATNGSQHAGFAFVTGTPHATVWRGSAAADAIDLNDYLPPGFDYSLAWGIDANGDVVGVAVSETSAHAFLWTPIPEPAAFPLAIVTAALGVRRRRSR